MDRILGQDRALNHLRRVLASGRVHHAWIFSGPQGVGKCTTAREFAKRLLDPDAARNLAGEIDIHPDGKTAQLIDAEAHPDLHYIHRSLARDSSNPELRRRKLANMPLDVLREFVIGGRVGEKIIDGPAYRKAYLGHGKVFIIDEADRMDGNAQNTMLKTLEEPPPHTYFFLITARPERLFATIHSRCEHVRFTSLSEQAMQSWFVRSGVSVDDATRSWVESFAEGSPGLAQLAIDYELHEWRRQLAPLMRDIVQGHYPAEMGDMLASLVDEFAAAWVKKHPNASKDAANKDGARHLLTLLSNMVRTNLRTSTEQGDDPQPNLDMLMSIRQAELQLFANVNMKMVFENLIAQWTTQRQAAVV